MARPFILNPESLVILAISISEGSVCSGKFKSTCDKPYAFDALLIKSLTVGFWEESQLDLKELSLVANLF